MFTQKRLFRALLLGLLLGFPVKDRAQSNTNDVSTANATGVLPYNAYGGTRERISLTNGNLNLQIPLLSLPGRNGNDLVVGVEYDSKIWKLFYSRNYETNQLTYWWEREKRYPAIGTFGWRLSVPVLQSTLRFLIPASGRGTQCHTDFLLTLPDGSKHSFMNRAKCFQKDAYGRIVPQPSANIPVTDSRDATYLRLDTSNESDVVVRAKDGTAIHFMTNFSYYVSLTDVADKILDADGDVITIQSPGSSVSGFTDTVGRAISYGGTISYKDSSGTQRSITLTSSGVYIHATFVTPTSTVIGGGPSTFQMLTSITLPNNLTYEFEYNDFGELIKITYPSGGYTRYDYQRFEHSYMYFSSGSTWGPVDFREVVARRVCAEATGSCATEDTFTYTPTVDGSKPNNEYMEVVDSQGNLSRYRFSLSNYSPRELGRWTYQGTTTLLQSVLTDYNELDSGGRITSASLPIRVTTTLNSDQVSKVEWTYDSYVPPATTQQMSIDNPLEKREYDYGQGAPGPLVRKTVNTWLKTNPVNGQDYFSTAIHIMDRKASEAIYDGADNLLAQTQFEYDSYAEGITASGAVQHESSYGTAYTTRGNLTATKRWRNTDGTWLITRNNKFDDAGNVLKTTDPSSHQTLFSYADSWGNSTCAPGGGNAAAYMTSITNARGHVTTSTYNSCAGTVASTTDPNGRTTYFSYDSLNRLIQTDYPDGGQRVRSFLETTLPIEVQARTKQGTDPNRDVISTVTLDGLGRVARTRLDSDPDGIVRSQTEYDAYDRKKKVWDPTRCNPPDVNCGESTWGVTEFQYDALGRTTKVIPPDGSSGSNNITTVYTGNCTEVIDQAGKKRKTCNDALGRLRNIWEPNSGGSYVYETVYQYDVLDNLTQAQQKGNDPNSANWRTRTFGYNSLSQLTSANNPESGTASYGYDNCGNLTSKTDARSVSIAYAYDELHRLLSKNYSDTPANPDASYSYDGPDCLGAQFCYNTGRRTGMSDGAGTQAWSYDAMGRAIRDRRSTNSVTKDFAYEYYYTGATRVMTYPSGAVVQYDNTGAGRAQWAKDTARSINYATEAHYAPQGALSSLKNGASGGFNGYTRTYTYNERLQPHLISATSPTQTVFSLDYDFNLGVANNGNVMQIANTLVPERTQNFTYDDLNRIQQAKTQATSGQYCWGQEFTIDVWANLYRITKPSTHNSCTVQLLDVTIGANNRINGLDYDAAGNMTNDGVYSYTYDAENRQTTAAGVGYSYDGEGRRVKKSNGKLYWYSTSGEVLLETDLGGNSPSEYVFFDGKRMARRDPSGAVYYFFEDHLGSSRVVADASGSVVEESDFLPFGAERAIVDSLNNQYKFTGKERDTETGNDYFGARFYVSNLGRFLGPDAAPPNLFDPHSLNKYAYTLNNPLLYVDRDGNFARRWHEGLTVATLENEGLSGDVARSVANLNANVDLCCNSEAYAHMHSQMRTGESPEQAMAEQAAFVEASLDLAASAVLAGKMAEAEQNLAFALHAVQDEKHEFIEFSKHTGDLKNDLWNAEGRRQLMTDVEPTAVQLDKAAGRTLETVKAFEKKIQQIGRKQGLSDRDIQLREKKFKEARKSNKEGKKEFREGSPTLVK